jgi:hypothetical protein
MGRRGSKFAIVYILSLDPLSFSMAYTTTATNIGNKKMYQKIEGRDESDR